MRIDKELAYEIVKIAKENEISLREASREFVRKSRPLIKQVKF